MAPSRTIALGLAALACLAGASCGGRRPSADAGSAGDAGGALDGALPTDGGSLPDGAASLDGGTPGTDGGSPGTDGGPTDADTVDRTPLRTTIPFRVQSFDIDREGNFAVVGRGTLGGTHLAIYCSGPSFRNGRLMDDIPAGSIVRRNRATSEVVVAWAASGAAGLTAWFLRALPASCDPSGPAVPSHSFDAEWIDGSFQSERVLAMDVSDAGDAWVLSEWGVETRLTRFESGLRREQIDVDSCDPRFSTATLAMALEPRTGRGVIACTGGGVPASGMFVRGFDRTGLLETSWTPVAGTDGAFSTPLFDVTLTDAGDIGLSRMVILTSPTRYERHLTTLTPAAAARGSVLLEAGTGSTTHADGFVRDRGAPSDFVVVLRPEGTLSRYDLDATAGGTAAGGTLAGASPVLVDVHGRTFALEGYDIVRGVIPLP